MSNHAMTMVWDAADAPDDPGPMWVLVILADHGNDHGGEDYRCWPSVERVMERSKFKRSAVESHLKALVMLGWISRRRRVRPDGRKHVYDYEIHRDPGFRADLRKARAAIAAAGHKPSGEAVDARHPCANSTHGPCVNSEPAMREIHAQPCVKSTHQEPVKEPLEEPSPGGSALRASFDNLVEAIPKRALKFAQIETEAWPWFRQAVEAGVIDPDVVIGCAGRMAVDPELKGRRYLPPLETWLAEGQWRSWLPEPELPLAEPDPVAASAAADRRPPSLPRDVADVVFPAGLTNYLGGATWQEDGRLLVCRLGIQAEEVRKRVAKALTELSVTVLSIKDFEARGRQQGVG